MKILFTGANGQLGKELLHQCSNHPVEPIATDIDELDICDSDQLASFFSQEHPDLVINTAAYTQVDKAESDQNLAFRINSEGAYNLAFFSSEYEVPMIHISTDYVFDGKKGEAYLESDPVSPQGVYACSKAEGETRIRATLPRHIILRTSWLYGVYGQNFVKTMLRLGQEKKALSVVDDQFGCPTSATDLASAVLQLAAVIREKASIRWGTYHYCGKGITTWYHFADKIFELAQSYKFFDRPQLEPVTTEHYPTAAVRPKYSALDCSLIQKIFDIHPEPWQESLAATIRRIIQDDTAA